MSNITLHVDDDIVRKVRKIAVDKNTTLTALVREFLESLARRDEIARGRALRALKRSFRTLSRDMGERTWTRDQLHER